MEEIKSRLSHFLEKKLIEEIISEGKLMQVKEGETVIDYGKRVKFMPLILTGTLKVLRQDENNHEILLYYLSSNESCAMAYTCCMEDKKSEIKAVAEDNVELLAIPHEKLDEWLVKYPAGRVIYLIALLNVLMSY